MLPSQGHVLGVDIGFSPKRRSSAACLLSWDGNSFDWSIRRFRYDHAERKDVIADVVGENQLLTVALDGPIRGSLDIIGRYRTAERLLTRKLQPHIGKPGQSSSPVGKKLNNATNEVARTILDHHAICSANHLHSIHEKAIVEAFPTSFMGLMLPNAGELSGKRDKKSDRFFVALSDNGTFEALLNGLAPGASFARKVSSITNHDETAAFVCALTALCVTTNNYTAVGDEDGWIILPPRNFIIDEFFDMLHFNAAETHNSGDETVSMFVSNSQGL